MACRSDIEDAIDAVRTNKQTSDLERIVAAFACKISPSLGTAELAAIADDVLFAVVAKIAKGVPTPSTAKQVWRITSNKIADLQKHKIRQRAMISPEELGDALADEMSPDIADLIEAKEALAELVKDFETIRAENPDYFEALIAVIDGVPVGQRIRERRGKTISNDTERQLKRRAKQKLAALISQRKEEVS